MAARVLAAKLKISTDSKYSTKLFPIILDTTNRLRPITFFFSFPIVGRVIKKIEMTADVSENYCAGEQKYMMVKSDANMMELKEASFKVEFTVPSK